MQQAKNSPNIYLPVRLILYMNSEDFQKINSMGAETVNSQATENLKFLSIKIHLRYICIFPQERPLFPPQNFVLSEKGKHGHLSRIPACLAVHLEPWQ